MLLFSLLDFQKVKYFQTYCKVYGNEHIFTFLCVYVGKFLQGLKKLRLWWRWHHIFSLFQSASWTLIRSRKLSKIKIRKGPQRTKKLPLKIYDLQDQDQVSQSCACIVLIDREEALLPGRDSIGREQREIPGLIWAPARQRQTRVRVEIGSWSCLDWLGIWFKRMKNYLDNFENCPSPFAYIISLICIFNRPGVAGAVLWTASSFINSLIHYFIQWVILFLQIFIIS